MKSTPAMIPTSNQLQPRKRKKKKEIIHNSLIFVIKSSENHLSPLI